MSINPSPFRRHLLAWYVRHRRDLPWRSDRPDPYHVLVSEAMLQQTQVATVIAYFQRFIARFPTVKVLAAAGEQDVFLLWQGLGYYRRAKNLHAAAKKILSDHGGEVPSDPAAIAELPGVGRYTAGAIASIAFAKPEPILDGNVARVLARWFAIEKPIDEPAIRDELWDLAAALVPPERPGDFNQAMMELGALICTPRQPQCLVCPVASLCRAHERGLVESIPARLPRRVPKKVEHHVVAIRRGEKFYFEQRPVKGLWAGLWQLPTAEGLGGAMDGADILAWAENHTALPMKSPVELAGFPYQTTHRTLSVRVWMAEIVGKPKRVAEEAMPGEWRDLTGIDDLPLSNMQKRAVELVRAATPRAVTPRRSPKH